MYVRGTAYCVHVKTRYYSECWPEVCTFPEMSTFKSTQLKCTWTFWFSVGVLYQWFLGNKRSARIRGHSRNQSPCWMRRIHIRYMRLWGLESLVVKNSVMPDLPWRNRQKERLDWIQPQHLYCKALCFVYWNNIDADLKLVGIWKCTKMCAASILGTSYVVI